MSVQVEISIAAGAASRHLSIELESTPTLDEWGTRDQTEVGEYAVLLSGGARKGSNVAVARFHHRYGDDVLSLITSAIAALRREGVDQA